MIALDIYGIGILISGIASVVFFLKNEEKKALISFIILLAIMLLKFLLA
tara:strand:- start:3 stop:149 length:147 start_codon:yes stop_codon:yes gene_type:complete